MRFEQIDKIPIMNLELTRLRRCGRFLWTFGFFLSVGWGQVGFAIDDLGGVKAAPATASVTKGRGDNPQSHANEVAQLVVDAWKHKVWSLYPVEKLKADESISSKSKGGRGEFVGGRWRVRELFMLVLRSEVPLRQVNVVGADLVGENERRNSPQQTLKSSGPPTFMWMNRVAPG